MKNRERLLKTSTYDTLVEMNKNLNSPVYNGDVKCIMDALIGDEKEVCNRCMDVGGIGHCEECIQTWLNEEEK